MGKLSYKLTLAAIMSFAAFSGASVLAVGSQANVHAENSTATVTTGKPADAGSQGTTHLAAAQLQACQKRETAVNNIIARIVDRSTKQIAVFDTIATRTENFYTSKGQTVANYDTLVAAVNTAKSKAQSDLAAMKTTDTMVCTGNDPKGIVGAFKDDLKLEIADLKAYKTAIKNLIVAVKSVQGTDSKTSNSSSSSTTTSQGGQQ